MRPLLPRIALALALLLGVAELLARAAFPRPEILGFDRSSYSPLGSAPGVEPPTSLGHASFTWASDPDGFEFVHALNLYGFRDREWRIAKQAGDTRVAFVGDSFVEGFSAGAEDTIPRVFAETAGERGRRVEALNLGLGGGTLESYARLARDALPLFRPDALVLVLFANDVVEQRLSADLAEPLVPRRPHPLAPRVFVVARRIAVGERVPRRWIEPPFPFLPAVPDPRNAWSDGRRAGQLAFVAPEIARAARAGRFNPALTDSMPWFEQALQRRVDLVPHLRFFHDLAQSVGSTFGVVYLPTKMQVSDRYLEFLARFSPPGSATSLLGPRFQRHARELAASCRELGIPYLDLTPTLRRADASSPVYWSYDDHLRPEGYRLAATTVLDWWERRLAPPATGAPATSSRSP